MKRAFIFLLTSLISFSMCGCALSGASSSEMTEVIEVSAAEEEPLYVDYQAVEDSFLEDFPEVIVYDSSEMTEEILENRDGFLIIERCIGQVLDEETGEGEILNCYSREFNYISYSGVSGADEGAIVLTYLVYSTENNYIDDVAERYDFVLCQGK